MQQHKPSITKRNGQDANCSFPACPGCRGISAGSASHSFEHIRAHMLESHPNILHNGPMDMQDRLKRCRAQCTEAMVEG